VVVEGFMELVDGVEGSSVEPKVLFSACAALIKRVC